MSELNGASVLLLEDEYLIALDAEQILLGLGAGEVAVACTLAEARALADERTFDVAMLDVNINGELSFPFAEELWSRSIPVVFATGYEMRDRTLPEFAVAITKPYTGDGLFAALTNAMAKPSR